MNFTEGGVMRIKILLAGIFGGLGAAVLLLTPALTHGQNLLANSSFEEFNTCTEYGAQCSPAAWPIVSSPSAKGPAAKDGIRKLPFIYDNVFNPMLGRQFPYTRILCPLLTGKEYILSFWLYTGEFTFSHLEVVLSPADPTRTRSVVGQIKASLALTKDDIVSRDKTGWFQIQRRFTAAAEENFILLGNVMLSDPYSHREERRNEKSSGNIFFFIDDIRLSAADPALNSCPEYAYNRETLYAEHHRHARHIYLDSLPPVNARQPDPDTQAVAPQSMTPPAPPPSDTLLIPGVLFHSNSSDLNNTYNKLLDSLITRIDGKLPSKIEINGHTDNTGPDEFNQTLSQKRALRIKKYIVEKLPSLELLMDARGYGSTRPVASNDSPAGKARNRRVEIILIY
jgi:outer membrane protein OmpA-like peptidoglycan-associated protein